MTHVWTHVWELVGFPNNFLQNISMLWEFVHSQTLEIAQFPINLKSVKKSRSWELSCAFPHLFCNMGIHSSYASVIAWKSASRNILKKPLTLKCLCFPIFFPYCVNSLFPCFGNCMDFCFVRNIWETQNFGMLLFFHPFPLLWEFTFPMFWELYGFLLQATDVRNP